MYLPESFTTFKEKFADIHEHHEALGQACRAAGPLAAKWQDLVKLGIAVGLNSRGAVMSQTRKALASGATHEEIQHVALLSLTTAGFPTMIAAMGWIDEVLKKNMPAQ